MPENAPSKQARRDPQTIGRITLDAAVLQGKPCIAGTRISVELVLEELSAGSTVDDLLKSYPHLDPGDVKAALQS